MNHTTAQLEAKTKAEIITIFLAMQADLEAQGTSHLAAIEDLKKSAADEAEASANLIAQLSQELTDQAKKAEILTEELDQAKALIQSIPSAPAARSGADTLDFEGETYEILHRSFVYQGKIYTAETLKDYPEVIEELITDPFILKPTS